MCGKFTFMATWAEVVDFSQPLEARPSNAPEQTATPMRVAPVLHLDANGQRTMTSMRWGFTEVRGGREIPKHMHARDDKLMTSRLWRPHFEERRGFLVVTSFNEGQEVPTYRGSAPTGNTKTVQWTMRPKDGGRLAIAVIFRKTASPVVGDVWEFVMCTTRANKGIAEFASVSEEGDKRMPAILPEPAHTAWLGEIPASLEAIRDLLQPYEDDGAWTYTPEHRPKPPPKPKAPEPPQGGLF